MSSVFLDATREGLIFPVAIDGTLITGVTPSSFSIPKEPLEEVIRTADGGSVTVSWGHIDGTPDRHQRMTFEVPFNYIAEATRAYLEELSERGGYRTLCMWRPMFAHYTARAAQEVFLLPRYRRHAGAVLAGLVYDGKVISTDAASCPVVATLNGVALTVNYENGPTVVKPAAGEITVARDARTSGSGTGYAEMRVGDALVAGDALTIKYVPVFTVRIESTQTDYPSGAEESQSYRFVER